MCFNYVERHVPKVSTAGGGIFGVYGSDEPTQRLLAAKENCRSQDTDDEHQPQRSAGNSAPHPAVLLFRFASVMAPPQANNEYEKHNFSEQTDNSTARVCQD